MTEQGRLVCYIDLYMTKKVRSQIFQQFRNELKKRARALLVLLLI